MERVEVRYDISIEKEDDMYVATDAITHTADQGDTPEEAEANLKEALELYYEDSEEAEGNIKKD